ncbi:MAG: endo alpha-1,4 polygalactosaminidase [Actinobacteria bacterium ATB1]|nr:endo alpha-1,4 polygalactosaminidase [Actinobacteria bacterium ATB1]
MGDGLSFRAGPDSPKAGGVVHPRAHARGVPARTALPVLRGALLVIVVLSTWLGVPVQGPVDAAEPGPAVRVRVAQTRSERRSALVEPPRAGPRWSPAPGTTWQIQFTGELALDVDAEVFVLDLFDTTEADIATLHGRGRRVVCYFSAGSWEEWRPDAAEYPDDMLGRGLDGWPGERWVDIRQLDVLGPILSSRMDLAARKGCDGVDPDNIDGYTYSTGFPLTAKDQIAFDTFLAEAAHSRLLAVGLKNGLGQIGELAGLFDFAVNEQCFEYHECDLLKSFTSSGKAVFHIEYGQDPNVYCPETTAAGLSSIRKPPALGPEREPCPA